MKPYEVVDGDFLDNACPGEAALVAAIRLGRRAYGCEVVPSYAQTARRWLQHESEHMESVRALLGEK